jgi:hypothetical protein
MYIFIIKEFIGFRFASLEIAIKQPYHQFAYLMPPILKTKHDSNVFLVNMGIKHCTKTSDRLLYTQMHTTYKQSTLLITSF